MRYLTLFCCLLAATSLDAQLFGGSENTWEISASFAPQLNKKISLSARIEEDLFDVPIARRNQPDTININGIDRVFRNTLFTETRPESSNFWFGATVRAHRRFPNGFDLSLGFHYAQNKHNGKPEQPLNAVTSRINNDQLEVLYLIHEDQQRRLGLVSIVDYHLFEKKKLHPYFGLGFTVLHRSWQRRTINQVFSGDGGTELPADPNIGSFNSQRIEFDFIANGGLLYQFSPLWSVGLEVTTYPGRGSDLVGVQARRQL